MAKSNRRILFVSLGALIVLTVLVLFSSAVSRLSGRTLAQQGHSNSVPQQPDKAKQGNQQDMVRAGQEIRSRYPTVDYNSPEPTNPDEKAKRKTRNKHYDKRALVASQPSDSGTATILDSEFDPPALPIAMSDVILTADVLNSEAHLSNDKSGVYSEFNVQVDSVLKGAIPALGQTNLISLSRLGGIVRYPSGHTERYEIHNQNMPAIGKKYLFFLKATEDNQAYEILTGYEIGQERILPLDYGSNSETFRGLAPTVFLNTVRDAIANKN